MAWVNINIKLSLSSKSIPCDGGFATATVTLSGLTDDADAVNPYVASLRDDHVIPDVLWNSGPMQAGFSERLERQFEIRLFCDEKCHVAGPDGSSFERAAEVYAHVLATQLEAQSDDVSVGCDKP